MKRFCIGALVTTLTFLASAEVPQTATILAIKKHGEGRIVSWSNRSPIFDGYPFYDLTFSWNGKKYVVRYESMTGYFPGAWQAGHDATVKRERGLFTLYNDREGVSAREVNPRDCVEVSAPPVGFAPLPQVPCD